MTPASPIDTHGKSEHSDGDESKTTIAQDHRDQQRPFQCAAEAIASGAGQGSGDPASFGIEVGNLENWALDKGALIPANALDSLPLVSNSTSEHEVFYRFQDDRVVKRTWPGVYGQIPVPADGGLGRRNATASEYLRRMALHIEVFSSDLRLEGVTISDKPSMVIGQPSGQPSIVISQRWYQKDGVATNEIIHAYLVEEGFRPVPSSYFGWYRPEDGVVIVDAKPDNFIRSNEGLLPIDLQMAQFSPEQLKAAGLTADSSTPIIFIPC